MPRKRIRTFFPRQIVRLRFLADIAYHEATIPTVRWEFECQCYRCNLTETRDGAVAAIDFLVAHNRHTTYIRGEKVEGEDH